MDDDPNRKASHVNGDPYCHLCAIKMRDAHHTIVFWFEEIKRQFPETHCSWTFRDQYYQDILYQTGKSRIRWPQSKHNAMRGSVPESRAMDLFRLNEWGFAEFSRFYYRDIADWVSKQNAPLIWGGSWPSFPDLDHFQLADDVV